MSRAAAGAGAICASRPWCAHDPQRTGADQSAAGAAADGRVQRALSAIRAGRPVVVLHTAAATGGAADGPAYGQLVVAAEHATTELVAFLVRHTTGFLCVALPEHDADRLQLAPMRATFGVDRPQQSVTVDALDGVTTGISAADRAHTVRLLAGTDTQPEQLSRPGHMVPLRARHNGVLQHPGDAEAAMDLCRLAGMRPVGLTAAIVSAENPADLADQPELHRFADEHGFALISVDDLVRHRRTFDVAVERVTEATLPTPWGPFRVFGYRDKDDGAQVVGLVAGSVGDGDDMLTRIHHGCLLGDALGALSCSCGDELRVGMQAVAREGRGVVLYLPGSRQHGPDASGALASVDESGGRCRCGTGAQVLDDLGVHTMRLMLGDLGSRAGGEPAVAVSDVA